MLLEFKTRNYKSFKEELVFSMIPAPKQSGLDYSVLTEMVGKKEYKGLCSAIIYGPNASGKTNIIGAMDTMKAIVLRGNIKNAPISSPNSAAFNLELIPNCDEDDPITEFSISFISQELKIDYSFAIEIGQFAEANHKRSIIGEKLIINDKLVFLRDNDLEVSFPKFLLDYQNLANSKNKSSTLDIAKASLNAEELFLVNGFKSIFSMKLSDLIASWFSSKLIAIYHADLFETFNPMEGNAENSIIVDKSLTEAAKAFGMTSNAIGFRKSPDNAFPEKVSIVNNRDVVLRSHVFESYGTLRFLNQFPTLAKCLHDGCTLVVDEFDASIHPMALMSIINIFHNDEINKHNAQLVFNTHNPIFLNASLFRRDEIKFVERNKKTNGSIHYSLSDFRTADGIRKGESYMKNYFLDRYGAIEDIDFTPVFKKVLNIKDEG